MCSSVGWLFRRSVIDFFPGLGFWLESELVKRNNRINLESYREYREAGNSFCAGRIRPIGAGCWRSMVIFIQHYDVDKNTNVQFNSFSFCHSPHTETYIKQFSSSSTEARAKLVISLRCHCRLSKYILIYFKKGF